MHFREPNNRHSCRQTCIMIVVLTALWAISCIAADDSNKVATIFRTWSQQSYYLDSKRITNDTQRRSSTSNLQHDRKFQSLFRVQQNPSARQLQDPSSFVRTLVGNGYYADTDGVGVLAGLNSPIGIALDPTEQFIFTTDFGGGGELRRISLATSLVRTIGIGYSWSNPQGIVVAPNSYIYVSDQHRISLMNPADNLFKTAIAIVGTIGSSGFRNGVGSSALLSNPYGLCVSSDSRYLFVADSDNHVIRRIDLQNQYMVTSLTLATSALQQPFGVVIDRSNAFLYVTSSLTHSVYKVAISGGAVTLVAGSNDEQGFGLTDGSDWLSARFMAPAGLSIDAMDNLYLLDQYFYFDAEGNEHNLHSVRLLSQSRKDVMTLAGKKDCVSQQQGTLDTRINVGCFADGPGGIATFYYPFGIAVSRNGDRVFVADTGNNRLRSITCIAGYNLTFGSCTQPSRSPTSPPSTVLPSSVHPSLLPSVQMKSPSNQPSIRLIVDSDSDQPSLKPTFAVTGQPSVNPSRIPVPVPVPVPSRSPTLQPFSKRPSSSPSSSSSSSSISSSAPSTIPTAPPSPLTISISSYPTVDIDMPVGSLLHCPVDPNDWIHSNTSSSAYAYSGWLFPEVVVDVDNDRTGSMDGIAKLQPAFVGQPHPANPPSRAQFELPGAMAVLVSESGVSADPPLPLPLPLRGTVLVVADDDSLRLVTLITAGYDNYLNAVQTIHGVSASKEPFVWRKPAGIAVGKLHGHIFVADRHRVSMIAYNDRLMPYPLSSGDQQQQQQQQQQQLFSLQRAADGEPFEGTVHAIAGTGDVGDSEMRCEADHSSHNSNNNNNNNNNNVMAVDGSSGREVRCLFNNPSGVAVDEQQQSLLEFDASIQAQAQAQVQLVDVEVFVVDSGNGLVRGLSFFYSESSLGSTTVWTIAKDAHWQTSGRSFMKDPIGIVLFTATATDTDTNTDPNPGHSQAVPRRFLFVSCASSRNIVKIPIHGRLVDYHHSSHVYPTFEVSADSVFAGSTQGLSGDLDGLGTFARFNTPTAMTIDSSGTGGLYLVDMQEPEEEEEESASQASPLSRIRHLAIRAAAVSTVRISAPDSPSGPSTSSFSVYGSSKRRMAATLETTESYSSSLLQSSSSSSSSALAEFTLYRTAGIAVGHTTITTTRVGDPAAPSLLVTSGQGLFVAEAASRRLLQLTCTGPNPGGRYPEPFLQGGSKGSSSSSSSAKAAPIVAARSPKQTLTPRAKAPKQQNPKTSNPKTSPAKSGPGITASTSTLSWTLLSSLESLLLSLTLAEGCVLGSLSFLLAIALVYMCYQRKRIRRILAGYLQRNLGISLRYSSDEAAIDATKEQQRVKSDANIASLEDACSNLDMDIDIDMDLEVLARDMTSTTSSASSPPMISQCRGPNISHDKFSQDNCNPSDNGFNLVCLTEANVKKFALPTTSNPHPNSSAASGAIDIKYFYSSYFHKGSRNSDEEPGPSSRSPAITGTDTVHAVSRAQDTESSRSINSFDLGNDSNITSFPSSNSFGRALTSLFSATSMSLFSRSSLTCGPLADCRALGDTTTLDIERSRSFGNLDGINRAASPRDGNTSSLPR